jgi:2-oxoglutarate ferredoxin oxidoreductase subunit alpha
MSAPLIQQKKTVTIRFAGDSGDGIQLTGTQFTNTAASLGNDLSTFPNFPAEIRAPQGTQAGVSGFQIKFGSVEIFTPGDECDVLVVMNAAALKANIKELKPNGIVIVNTDGFNARDLELAKIDKDNNPLTNGSLDGFKLYQIDVTKLTRTALEDSGLGKKEIDMCKNMFVLGYVYWIYNRPLALTISALQEQFKKKPAIFEANVKVLKAGYAYGDTTETPMTRYEVAKANMPSGEYRNINGNPATALGLVAAAEVSKLPIFFATYPITPASDILHDLSKHKNFNVKTFQAEDEIAAICAAIGASFGGSLGVTSSSGPGIALKTEAIGLATMLELPLVIINVQRGGPSTGLPTKTEQADLMQAIYGRNGECPVPVVAACSPSDCFTMVYEACRIAVEHMTPVFFMSDGYIANGAEPWKFPQTKDLKPIEYRYAEAKEAREKYLPYVRNNKLARAWAIPGTKGLEHRIGGLEKENLTGDISYDPDNHEFMVKLRQERVDAIADFIPLQTIDQGNPEGDVLVIGWGSTYGSIRGAVTETLAEGINVAHAHIKYLNPLPKNLGDILKRYKKVIVPEINNGQLVRILRDKYLVDAKGINKIKGTAFTTQELVNAIKEAGLKQD